MKEMKCINKQAEIDKFNAATDNEEFSPESLAAILDVSTSWLQKKRCEGGGIPFQKFTTEKYSTKNRCVSLHRKTSYTINITNGG
ncbi:DNA-binding protein [Acinetobacter seifertii]|nr:DNA-binding protein [Acinetobacter seifertii]